MSTREPGPWNNSIGRTYMCRTYTDPVYTEFGELSEFEGTPYLHMLISIYKEQ